MDNEITISQLSALEADSCIIIDIRDEAAFAYGHIYGAINLPADKIFSINFDKSKVLIVYCRTGNISDGVAEALRELGYRAYNLKGGYVEWLRHNMVMGDNIARQVEDSIRSRRFHSVLFSRFAKAVVTYDLIRPKDKIAVCMSGGKDSFLMAKLFQELKRHNKFEFDLVFLVMDPGYDARNREIIEKNARALDIPITVFESDIFENVFNIEKSPCYICARMRRGYLYAKAKELGCNKIALGHHYDDVIETILMGMLYGAQIQTMMPIVKSSNFEGMSLIRPMYLIREDDIKAWRDHNGLRFIQCACKFTDNCSSEACQSQSRVGSKRIKVKELIKKLADEDPQVEQNIFRSVENVNLSTVIAYKDKDGVRHRFDELDLSEED